MWETTCKKKDEEGLRLKDVKIFNKALLNKGKFRCINDEDALWYDLLSFMYDPLSQKLIQGCNFY